MYFLFFYISHVGGLVVIIEFVFHYVRCDVGDVSMCIFCTWGCGGGNGENSKNILFSRGGGSD